MVVLTTVKVRRSRRKVNLNKFRNSQPLSDYWRANLQKTLLHTRKCLHGAYPDYNPNLGDRRTNLMQQTADIVIRLILN